MTYTDLQRLHLRNVLRHVEAEMANDVDRILTTIEAECRYPLLHRTDDGDLKLEVVTDLNGAGAYYRQMRTGVDIVSSRHIRRITTDWYVFNHSVATMRHVGDVAGIAPTQREYGYESAVLFPVARDGIVGEIPWNRYSFPELVRGVVERSLTDAERIDIELRNLSAHDAYCQAMAAGGPIADVSFLAKGFRSASRNYFSPGAGGLSAVEGAEGFRAQVQTLHRAAEVVEMVVVNRVVTAWYVFAELAWRLRARSPESLGVSGDFDLKTAALFPVDENGRILAELGYGTDLPLIEGREPIGGAATVQHAGASVA